MDPKELHRRHDDSLNTEIARIGMTQLDARQVMVGRIHETASCIELNM